MQTRLDTFAKGIDISHYQGVVDWVKLKKDNISFAIIKATEGKSMVDDYLVSNVKGAKSVGILTGSYHFCHAKTVQEAIQEAMFYCSMILPLKLELPPVLDIETADAPKELVVPICHAFLETVEKLTGVRPMIYADRSYIDDNFNQSLSIYPLWLACYGDDTPTDRGGWKEWDFIQTSETGKLDGILSAVDINYYKGSVEDMFGVKMSLDTANVMILLCKHQYALATTDADRTLWHNRKIEICLSVGLAEDYQPAS